jgi:hypothetical protein
VPVHVAPGHGPRAPPVDRHVAALRTTGLRSPACSRTGRRQMECRTPHASGGHLDRASRFPEPIRRYQGVAPDSHIDLPNGFARTGREARRRACRSLPDGRSERHVNVRPCPRSPAVGALSNDECLPTANFHESPNRGWSVGVFCHAFCADARVLGHPDWLLGARRPSLCSVTHGSTLRMGNADLACRDGAGH